MKGQCRCLRWEVPGGFGVDRGQFSQNFWHILPNPKPDTFNSSPRDENGASFPPALLLTSAQVFSCGYSSSSSLSHGWVGPTLQAHHREGSVGICPICDGRKTELSPGWALPAPPLNPAECFIGRGALKWIPQH